MSDRSSTSAGGRKEEPGPTQAKPDGAGGYAHKWLKGKRAANKRPATAGAANGESPQCFFADHYPPEVVTSPSERSLLQLVCSERTDRCLHPLQDNINLRHLARAKAWDIVRNGYFSHESPTYGSIYDMIRRANIPFHYAGENLGKAGSYHVVHRRLMGSSGHRRNILNPRFDQVGIGVIKGQFSGVVVVQAFTGLIDGPGYLSARTKRVRGRLL